MSTQYVLLVDDELHVTYVLGLKLSAAGVRYECARSGSEALAIASRETPALVVTDFQMPGMSGLELAAKLRTQEKTADVPLFLLTARGHRISPNQLEGTSIQAVLDKPFSPRQMIGLIVEILDMQRGAEETGCGEAA